jgi:hypothetical protein
MGRRAVMLVFPHVGRQLRVNNPAERHKPEREPYDDDVSNATFHKSYRRAAAFIGSFF